MTRREFAGLAASAAAFGALGVTRRAIGASGSPRWYKGMLHAHTCWSDGYVLPEQAVAAYKNGGYDFFSITDHNRLGTDTDYWMEVAEVVIRETRDQVGHLAAKKGNPPHIFFVNHPHWRYYDVLPADIIANPDIRFFEVCNTGSAWAPEDSLPKDGFDNDRFWDAVNAVRCKRGERLLYGIGTDDTHMYPNSGTSRCAITYGDAWIGVRAAALTPSALFAAMKNGDFYASCGVDFEDIQFNRSTGTLSVLVPSKAGVSYTVKFITTKSEASVEPVRTVELPQQDDRPARSVPVYSDAIGAVVKTVTFGSGESAAASYTLAADDLYVRARVESNEPATYPNAINRMHPPMKVGWTQPYRREQIRYIHDVSV